MSGGVATLRLDRLLAKRREDRYESASAAIAAIDAHLQAARRAELAA